MKEETTTVRIITADEGKVFKNTKLGKVVGTKIALAIGASPSDFIEIDKPLDDELSEV